MKTNKLVMEALGGSFPGPSQDPDDYEIDAQQIQQALAYLKQRFVATHGEAEWAARLPMFQQQLLAKNPAVASKMRGTLKYKPLQRNFGGGGSGEEQEPEGLGQGLDQQALDTDPEYRSGRAMRDEPNLRRGESLVARIIGNVNG